MISKYIMLLFMLNGVFGGMAQNLQELQKNLRWNEGNVTLNTEEYFFGEVRYDEIQGIVSFRSDNKSDDKQSFQTSEILKLEYRDLDGRLRTFYSLAFTHDEIGREEICFYEVIKAFENFSVLSTRDEQSTNRTQVFSVVPMPSAITIARSLQHERIYFLDHTGKSELYTTIVYEKIKGNFFRAQGDGGKILNENLFPKYLGKHWLTVKRYVRENRLRLNNREGIVGALEYYAVLIRAGQ